MEPPEQNVTVGQVLALVAHSRHFRKAPEGLMELLQQPIRGDEAVLGDELPNFLKVGKRVSREVEFPHGCRKRRWALAARSWRKASSPSTVSPRSISSRP